MEGSCDITKGMNQFLSDKVPQSITDDVKTFCNDIVFDVQPIYVLCKPEPYAQMQDCYPAVEEKIERDGGSIQYGWQIWKHGDLFIEAEFHAVWCDGEGELTDITPKPGNLKKILFLPDNEKKYEDQQINNVRKNLTDNPVVDDYINGMECIFLIHNKGERAFQLETLITRAEKSDLDHIQTMMPSLENLLINGYSENDQCFVCRKGAPYKYCHGKKFRKLVNRIMKGN